MTDHVGCRGGWRGLEWEGRGRQQGACLLSVDVCCMLCGYMPGPSFASARST